MKCGRVRSSISCSKHGRHHEYQLLWSRTQWGFQPVFKTPLRTIERRQLGIWAHGDHDSLARCWAQGWVFCASAGVIRQLWCLSLWRRQQSFLLQSALSQEMGSVCVCVCVCVWWGNNSRTTTGGTGQSVGVCALQAWPGIGINHLQKLSGQTGGSYREKVKLAAKATAKFSLVPKAGLN
jgi:hypothetical protein